MQTPDDEFPYTSEDPSLAPVEPVDSSLVMSSQQASDLKTALRLVIGSGLNGKDVLTARLQHMQAMQEPAKIEAVTIDENETTADRMRYLLLGILFEAPDVIQRGLASAGGRSSKGMEFISRLTAPLTKSRVFSPVKNQYDQAAARGEKVLDRLIMKGRIEEHNSRQMLQEKAIEDLLNEVVEYLVVKVKVQEIIQQEGATITGDVIGEFQQESSNVDALLENKLKSIFRKSASSEPDAPASNPSEGGMQP